MDEWWEGFAEGRCALGPITSFDAASLGGDFLGGEMPRLNPKGIAPSGVWRKMDNLAKSCLTASRSAWRDAELDLSPAEMENVALLFGTNAGSIEHTEMFDRGAAPAPRTEPDPVPEHGAQLGGRQRLHPLGIHGPTCTYTSGGVSGSVALLHAADLIRQGEADVALVMAGDTLYRTILFAATGLGMVTQDRVQPFDEAASGSALAGDAVTVVLKSADHTRAWAPGSTRASTGTA